MNPQLIQNLKDLMTQIKMSKNPTAMLNQMILNNGGLTNALTYIKQHGGNAQTAFYALAQERGIDPNFILKNLQ